MENEEWGPWIAHDGVGRVKHIKVGDVVQFQGVAWDKPFENVRTMTQFHVDADCTSNPAGRSSPDQVDGVLSEMSLELLATLRAGAAKIQSAEPAIPYGASEIVAAGIRARHRRNQAAQASLSDAMQRWGGMRLAAGDDDTAMQARFLYRFGVDCMTAQGLAERAALELRDEINVALG